MEIVVLSPHWIEATIGSEIWGSEGAFKGQSEMQIKIGMQFGA